MPSNNPIPAGRDVRDTRIWHNDISRRLSSIESQSDRINLPTGPAGNAGKSIIAIALVLADTSKADIYRGEGDNERKIAENVDITLRSDFAAVEGQRLLALKVRDVWECYMIVDGVANGRTAATLQSLTVKEDNSLEWKDELPDGSHPGDILVWEEDEPVGENPPEGRWVNLGINPTAGNILHYTTGDTWELLSNPPSQSVLVHDGDNHISWMEVEEFECPTEEE